MLQFKGIANSISLPTNVAPSKDDISEWEPIDAVKMKMFTPGISIYNNYCQGDLGWLYVYNVSFFRHMGNLALILLMDVFTPTLFGL